MRNRQATPIETTHPTTLCPRLRLLALLAAAQLAACVPPDVRTAAKLIDSGDYAGAEHVVDRALDRQPRNQALLAAKIRVLVANERRAEAVALYRRHPSGTLAFGLAKSVLWWALQHPSDQLRLDALQAVRALDASSLMRHVHARLEDPDPVVRTWAAVALSRLPTGANVLERQLTSQHRASRAIALRELGRIAQSAALPTLSGCVGETDAAWRSACATGLGYTDSDRAVALLIPLTRDSAPSVRHAALQAIGRLHRPSATSSVEAACNDAFLGARLAAIDALFVLDAKRAIAKLSRLAEGTSPYVALRVGVQLARQGTVQPGLNAIARGLVDRQAAVRIAALAAASQVADPVAKKLARKALRDAQPQVRLAAARAIGDQLDTPRLRQLTEQLCAGSLDALCAESITLLAGRDRALAKALLLKLLKRNTQATLRAGATASYLSRSGDMAFAVDRVADPMPEVALAAAKALYRRYR
ncbi:MAG: HEAT repeat domain-containing protein [Deltaproteobacteria bacterium]|nr:HEAT repeat domain-containing protein [Deltaproteobacteria bacterium]